MSVLKMKRKAETQVNIMKSTSTTSPIKTKLQGSRTTMMSILTMKICARLTTQTPLTNKKAMKQTDGLGKTTNRN